MLPEAASVSPPTFDTAPFETAVSPVADSFFDTDSLQPPSSELMGMMLDGVETIEYPIGSDQIWTRAHPESDWQPKR